MYVVGSGQVAERGRELTQAQQRFRAMRQAGGLSRVISNWGNSGK